MNTAKIFYPIILLIAITAIHGCKKDDDNPQTPPPVLNETEVITTLTLTMIDTAGVMPTVTATFRDADGDGGNGPTVFDTIMLYHNTVYRTSILLLDETKIPADTVSNEVLEENTDHLFCFTISGLDLGIVRTDTDGTYEVGLQSEWTAGATGSGSVQVVLRHQPGVKNGSCDPGETDVDVLFPVVIN